MASDKETKRSVRPASGQKAAPGWLTTDRMFIGGSVLAILAILGVIVVVTAQNGDALNRQIDGVQIINVPAPGHVTTPVTYEQIPPAGGLHHPVWQQCGVYTEPIANEHAVHSLEHGAVWITYQPDLPADQVAILQTITVQSTHRLLSPYSGIFSPIILTAWGYQLPLERADDPRLAQFLQKYEQGKSTPEMGATCNGGETRTLAQIGQR